MIHTFPDRSTLLCSLFLGLSTISDSPSRTFPNQLSQLLHAEFLLWRQVESMPVMKSKGHFPPPSSIRHTRFASLVSLICDLQSLINDPLVDRCHYLLGEGYIGRWSVWHAGSEMLRVLSEQSSNLWTLEHLLCCLWHPMSWEFLRDVGYCSVSSWSICLLRRRFGDREGRRRRGISLWGWKPWPWLGTIKYVGNSPSECWIWGEVELEYYVQAEVMGTAFRVKRTKKQNPWRSWRTC